MTGWQKAILIGFGLVVALAVLAYFLDEERPGDPEVYERIESMTDCAALQETFDRNMDDAERREPNTFLRDVVLSYAETADDRMREVGCYG